jgi:hypothetical protein
MTQTKSDNIGVAMVLFVTLIITAAFTLATYEWATGEIGITQIQKIVLTLMAYVIGPIYMLIELPKLKSLTLDKNKIVIKNLLTRRTKEFLLDEIDGFKTSSQSARGGLVYEIIFFKQGRPAQVISSSYIKNYDDIRNQLGKQLTNLGADKFDFFRYVKERLTN